MSKKTKSSKSTKKPQPQKKPLTEKKLSEPVKAGLKAVAATAGSKLSQVIALLSRPEGVTLDEIVKATSWQKHTVRGAMSGTLKKKHGYTIVSDKKDGGIRVYKIAKQ